MSLVTVTTFKFRARVDFEGDDAELQSILDDAESTVIDYLKTPDHGWTASDVPGEVRHAIVRVALLMLDQTTSDEPVDFIDEGVRSLLHRHRDPALR